MGDLVERLRKNAPEATKPKVAAIMDEAADEIERLRARVVELEAQVNSGKF